MIRLESVSIHAGKFRLDEMNMNVPDYAYAVLMGQTGCGKSSLLEAICGLRRIQSGRIFIGERDVTREKPGNRGIGYMPQDSALFPTMTVQRHLEFPLRLRRWDRAAIQNRVRELADHLGIAHLLTRRPRGLSGGERQRVALGRALSFHPNVLCLDEPLCALDETTQERLQELLRKIHQTMPVTVLHVTHSASEAKRLGTFGLRLAEGKLMKEEDLLLPPG